MLGVALDPVGRVLAEHKVASTTAAGSAALVELLEDVVCTLEARAGSAAGAAGPATGPAAGALLSATSVGLGLPGRFTDGILAFAPNLPSGVGHDVAHPLAGRLGVPVVVDNDATCATLAEWQVGAAAGASDVVLVAVGTGIGAGLVVGGQLVRGRHGFAGEAGHLTLDPAGPPCRCGRRGCWEQYASGGALHRLAAEAAAAGRLPAAVAQAGGDPAAVYGEHVVAAAAAGDPASAALLDQVGRWFGRGLGLIATLLDPEVVVVGGGLAAGAPSLLHPARRALAEDLPGQPPRPAVEVRPAQLGPQAGAIGAALLGRARPPLGAGPRSP